MREPIFNIIIILYILLTILFCRSIDGIIYLAVFHSNGSRMVYFRGQSSIFRGPGKSIAVSSLTILTVNVTFCFTHYIYTGPMWIVGPYAYFQHFAIDPRVSSLYTDNFV